MVALLDLLGRSLHESASMLLETLWPLLSGFMLSGIVQAFVTRRSLERKLGSHRPRAVLRASAYGMASSSCSYAAAAMSMSLFVRGADFVASLVFLFASTNLVVELGIVLVVLLGWQFAAAEFVGGAVMIVLLAGVGGLWFRGRQLDAARAHVGRVALGDPDRARDDDRLSDASWSMRLRSPDGWARAGACTVANVKMLRKELVIGFLVAGLLATAVPADAWSVVFVRGHGGWTLLENALVGPLVALASFVCSIGNVPIAAALWHGGISFGGVIAFVFADLISFPLLLVYRRYYGTPMMLRMLLVFWAAMAAAGLVTELVFAAAGFAPTTRGPLVHLGVGVGVTTYLDVASVAGFAVLAWYSRRRRRARGDHVVDPVCGMVVDLVTAPARRDFEGQRYAFCTDRCAERFDVDPARLAVSRTRTEGPLPPSSASAVAAEGIDDAPEVA